MLAFLAELWHSESTMTNGRLPLHEHEGRHHMKKLLTLGILAAVTASMTGCGVIPLKGTSMAAITIDHVASDPVVDNSVRPVKKGVASAKGIILFNTGDASIGAAMREGGLSKVHHVDYDVTNILFLYNEIKTTVYGE